MVVWSVPFCALAGYIIKINKRFNLVTNILNVTSFSLVAVCSINIVFQIVSLEGKGLNLKESSSPTSAQEIIINKSSHAPDIYYIIVDSYPSADLLKRKYNFDNSEFCNYLISKGFFIASKSHSNYSHTFPSLASSLNMEYINYLASDNKSRRHIDLEIFKKKVEDSEVNKILKAQGYNVIYNGFIKCCKECYECLESDYR